MPRTLDILAHDALVLPPDQRVALAYQLLLSIEPGAQSDADEAWDTEIRARIARFDAAPSQTISAEDAFGRLRAIAPGE
jgi:putative addiction module component (TIGR02574 family)